MFDVDYIRPAGLKEALTFIDECGPDTTILAGGTDVMIDMRSGDLQNKYLLDVSRLPELKCAVGWGRSDGALFAPDPVQGDR